MLEMELVKFEPVWVAPLKDFLDAIADRGEKRFFSPHAVDEASLSALSKHSGKDLYLLLVNSHRVLGYGLLRGWDKGYSVPSLGIAIHPDARGTGFARALMEFLHAEAGFRGSSKVRLRVHAENQKALSLYTHLGYIFAADESQDQYLVGFKELQKVVA